MQETNVEIVNVDYNTKFNIVDAKRKQSGIYKIIATNKHGKDEAEVEIVILCEFPLMRFTCGGDWWC